jgi:iron complex outermembrane receptor protein
VYLNTGEYSSPKVKLEGSFYINWINDFIYLRPSPTDIRLTIRGAFPVFKYTQTNANLTGFDGSFSWRFAEPLSINLKCSVLWGWDVNENQYLVWMPADRVESSLHYDLQNIGVLEDFHVSLGVLSVSRQFKAPANGDFVDPPAGYSLMNAHVGFSVPAGNNRLGIYLNVDNLLNTRYRDYLNRFRYYADDLGRNVTLKLKYDFHSH